jgi:hypothetical protein
MIPAASRAGTTPPAAEVIAALRGAATGSYVYTSNRPRVSNWIGRGSSDDLAWADACSALRLDKEKH